MMLRKGLNSILHTWVFNCLIQYVAELNYSGIPSTHSFLQWNECQIKNEGVVLSSNWLGCNNISVVLSIKWGNNASLYHLKYILFNKDRGLAQFLKNLLVCLPTNKCQYYMLIKKSWDLFICSSVYSRKLSKCLY